MKVLVLNCGSSSLKYQLIDMSDENVIAQGNAERIGLTESFIKHKYADKKEKHEGDLADHKVTIDKIIKILLDTVISSLNEIDAVGHRVVHGGEFFSKSVIIDEEVKQSIKDCVPLAPLHNPANLTGIEACEEILPGKPQVGVFDTAFHQTMPEEAYIYPIPYEYYEKYKIRKYGFHGTSHKFISDRAAELMGKSVTELNIITCHLGNGASIAAIQKGKCINTSMGFTPLAGLIMGTRCGDIDPAIIKFLMTKEGLSIEEVDTILNKKSGLLGVSGISSDQRDIEEEAWNKKNHRAQLSLDKYYLRVKKFIGMYSAILDGVDAIVFAGGIGEMSPETREGACGNLEHFGIILDKEINKTKGKEVTISRPDSKVNVFVIPTNEELVIARDTKELVSKA